MQVEGFLTKDEALRLECLRLAVTASQPDLREEFYTFMTTKPQPTASELATHVAAALNKIEADRSATTSESRT